MKRMGKEVSQLRRLQPFDSAQGSRHCRKGAAGAARTRRRGDRIAEINPLRRLPPGTISGIGPDQKRPIACRFQLAAQS